MEVFVVFRNDVVERVFLSAEAADKYKGTIKGWNTWAVVKTTIDGITIPDAQEVPEDDSHIWNRSVYAVGYAEGWNDCREATIKNG